MIYGFNIIRFEETNPVVPRPDPKEGFYIYFFADATELAEIAQYSSDLAAMYKYTYPGTDLFYCNSSDFYSVDTTGSLYTMLREIGLINYDYFLKSNRPGYGI